MSSSSDMSSPVNEKPAATIHTLGCRLNQAETRLLEEQLRQAGYEIVPFNKPASLGIIHGCVVTLEAEAKTRKYIQRFKRRNPEGITVVIGCYAQTEGEKAMVLGVDLVLGNASKMDLLNQLKILRTEKRAVNIHRPQRESFAVPWKKEGATLSRRINLKIQDGCDEMCSYCYIPFARGRSRSRHLEDSLEEAASLVERGARELILTGVNIGDYRDGEADLLSLIDGLNTLRPRPRIRISSIEFNSLPEAVLERMAHKEHGLLPYLHIPLQSGSDTILKAMGRPYSGRAYLEFLEKARREVPSIGLGADVMVGFPGETEAYFEETRQLIEDSPLDYLHVFSYSERPAVASYRLSDKVSHEDKRHRNEILRLLADEKQTEAQQRFLGKECRILFEVKRGDSWTGYNEEYFEVALRSDEDLRNKVVDVHIEGIEEGKLRGVMDKG